MKQILYLFCFCGPLSMAGDLYETYTGTPKEQPSRYQELKKTVPSDVAALIDRIVECNYWAGEMPGNSHGDPITQNRIDMIKKKIIAKRCKEIAQDEKQLKANYKNNKDVLKAIEESKTLGPSD